MENTASKFDMLKAEILQTVRNAIHIAHDECTRYGSSFLDSEFDSKIFGLRTLIGIAIQEELIEIDPPPITKNAERIVDETAKRMGISKKAFLRMGESEIRNLEKLVNIQMVAKKIAESLELEKQGRHWSDLLINEHLLQPTGT